MTMTEPTARDYVIAICKTFQILESVLMHKTDRGREAVIARQVMWRLMKDADYSVSEIGRRSCRDHSTVLHGLKRIEAALKRPEIAEKMEAARLLVPQIAHRRAQGEVFILDVVVPPPLEKRQRVARCEAPRPIVKAEEPKRVLVPQAFDLPGDPLEVTRMRAEVRAADLRFAEALMGDMA
jgi:hypothetical protein